MWLVSQFSSVLRWPPALLAGPLVADGLAVVSPGGLTPSGRYDLHGR
jgi:hypothetical protein